LRFSILILACLLLGGCYKSSLGLRGMGGLGEVMTKSASARNIAEAEPLIPIVDAHTQFENALDEAGTQPSWGMEVAFRGANVLGGVARAGQTHFFPKIDKKFTVKLAVCGGSAQSPSAQKHLAHGLEKGVYRCVLITHTASSSQREFSAGLAAKFHVPVLLEGRGGKSLDWEALIARHANVNFVLAALGWPSPKDGLRLVAKYPNAYADTSVVVHPEAGYKSASETSQKIQEILRPFAPYPKKILFGSSYPLAVINPGIDAVRAVFPKAHWPEVLHGNAIRIYKLDLTEAAFEVAKATPSANGAQKENVPPGNE